MSAVDVLAVMDRLIGNTRMVAGMTGDPAVRAHLLEGEQARAAVAELIEASKAAMVLCAEACGHANPAMRQDAILRRDALAAALARCKGEQA